MAQNAKAARITAAYGEIKKLIENPNPNYGRIVKTANRRKILLHTLYFEGNIMFLNFFLP